MSQHLGVSTKRKLTEQFIAEILEAKLSGKREWHHLIDTEIGRGDCEEVATNVGCWVRHEDGMTRFYLRW